METNSEIKAFQQIIQDALDGWHKPDTGSSPFEDLQVYKDIGLSFDGTSHQLTRRIILSLLEALEVDDKTLADLISRKYLEGDKIREIARTSSYSEATIYRMRNKALDHLATLLRSREAVAIETRFEAMEARLEQPSYADPIGVEAPRKALEALLTKRSEPWITFIVGIGGIGKTTLADVVAREILRDPQFDDFGWISARHQVLNASGIIKTIQRPAAIRSEDLVDQLVSQLMPNVPKPDTLSMTEARNLLRTRVKQKPHLIVIDNLETVQDIEELLPLLRDLANPTKFLLTSRENLYHEPDLYHFPLPELSESNSLRLIKQEITRNNRTHLQKATDQDLGKIYQAVGGNPLAIRLVVGQTHIFDLDTILNDLVTTESQTIEDMYNFIYHRAWDALPEPTRELFLAFVQIPDDGETLDDLVELSALERSIVQTGLKHLVDQNLVNSTGDHQQRHYTIHNLTRSYLQTQILKWQP